MKIKVDLKILALFPEYNHMTLGIFLDSKLRGVVAVKDWDEALD